MRKLASRILIVVGVFVLVVAGMLISRSRAVRIETVVPQWCGGVVDDRQMHYRANRIVDDEIVRLPVVRESSRRGVGDRRP